MQPVCVISGKSFLVLYSICLNSFLVHFKNGPEYHTRGTTEVFILLMRFHLCNLVMSIIIIIGKENNHGIL